MEVICAILTALFGIGFGIFMALHPEDAIALHDRGRYTQAPEPTEEYIRLTRRQAGLLRDFLRREDPEAFLTIVNSSEIIGKGFQSI